MCVELLNFENRPPSAVVVLPFLTRPTDGLRDGFDEGDNAVGAATWQSVDSGNRGAREAVASNIGTGGSSYHQSSIHWVGVIIIKTRGTTTKVLRSSLRILLLL